MEHLFSPFTIKTYQLKNRIVMPSLASFLIDNDGFVTNRTIDHYRLRAAGGPAMVFMEACAVSEEGFVSPHQPRIYDDRYMVGLSKIAAVIKAEGAVPAVQIHHGGRQISPKVINRKPLAPSALPSPHIKGEVEPLTVDGIKELVVKFGEAAERLSQIGFELIEIHGAHGYLVNQFLSGFSNIREDQYGGDVYRRTRFAKEIVEAVRNRIPAHTPLSFKISAQEFVPNGLTLDESTQVLKILVEAGVDIVQISAGTDATPEWISQPMFMPKACLADSAEKIKKRLQIPVMAVGRINDPVVANQIIEQGKADLVCIGRGLLADPQFPKKAQAGELDDIRICIACNTCMQSIFRLGRIECLVNPTLGREKEMAIYPAEKKKKVMVIGSGPGGMDVAWVAARRGHDVKLFEKQNAPGGQLTLAALMGYKKELTSLIRFQTRQIRKFGVTCHYNSEVTPAMIKKENPDVVIIATGSCPIIPEVPGAAKKLVIPYPDVLSGHIVGKTTVVVGGGATGFEVALHVSEAGNAVTIIEIMPKVGKGLEAVTKKVFLQKLHQNQVEIMTESKLVRVEENGVVVNGKEDGERFIQAEMVVFAIGSRPDNSLYETIKSQGYEVHMIGDCLEPRNAKAAIYEGAVLGRSL